MGQAYKSPSLYSFLCYLIMIFCNQVNRGGEDKQNLIQIQHGALQQEQLRLMQQQKQLQMMQDRQQKEQEEQLAREKKRLEEMQQERQQRLEKVMFYLI